MSALCDHCSPLYSHYKYLAGYINHVPKAISVANVLKQDTLITCQRQSLKLLQF